MRAEEQGWAAFRAFTPANDRTSRIHMDSKACILHPFPDFGGSGVMLLCKG